VTSSDDLIALYVELKKMSNEEILFYTASGKYGCFSNFSLYRMSVGGMEWETTEHYFQAQKFAGTDMERAIMAALTPARAKKMGNCRSLPIRMDWENVKEGVMEIALRAKFEQHPDIKKTLLSTDDKRLVEHTARDRYWGDGGDGSGMNRLGVLLMRLRASFASEVGGYDAVWLRSVSSAAIDGGEMSLWFWLASGSAKDKSSLMENSSFWMRSGMEQRLKGTSFLPETLNYYLPEEHREEGTMTSTVAATCPCALTEEGVSFFNSAATCLFGPTLFDRDVWTRKAMCLLLIVPDLGWVALCWRDTYLTCFSLVGRAVARAAALCDANKMETLTKRMVPIIWALARPSLLGLVIVAETERRTK
jgi:ribA/ribD-fused uncharacterized protein